VDRTQPEGGEAASAAMDRTAPSAAAEGETSAAAARTRAEPLDGPQGAASPSGPSATEPNEAAAGPRSASSGTALPTIPDYVILEELGRGGMGVVYQARHRRLHRLCAIKMVLAGPRASSEALVRFLGEAEVVAKLRHPGIVAIHHIGETEGLPFIELEYLGGGSLADQLDGTPRPSRSAAELVASLAEAVQAAHEAGVVHRDLKPANVLFDEHGAPKVADFGIAKAVGSDTGLTATDTILGTPSYMAPEQAGGHARDVGPAADVYALGAILYELLTGRPPFRAPTVLETLEQVRNTEPVPPTRLVPGMPRDLETIALKCLQKEPAKRYGSAAALADDLRRFLAGAPIVARPVPSWERLIKWGRRRPAIAALIVVVPLLLMTLVGLGIWSDVKIRGSLEEQRRQNAVTRVQLALREYEAANILDAEKHLDACPPDLRFWEWRLVNRLCHRETETFNDHEMHVWDVAFSPDGDWIASVSGGWLFMTGGPGRGEVRIRDAETGRIVFERTGLRHGQFAAAFDPASDGRYLATGGGLYIYEEEGKTSGPMINEGSLDVWDTTTGERRNLDAVDGQNVIDVAFSPDGGVLAAAYGVYIHPRHHGYARLWDVETGEPIGEPFPGLAAGVSAVAFSPDGRRLALAKGDTGEGQCEVEVWDWRARALVYSTTEASLFVKALAFDPTGRFLASAESRSRVVRLWDATTGEEVRIFQGHEGFIEDLAFTPNGEVLASCGQDNLVKLWDVSAGQEIETLRGHSRFVSSVAFDPEGRRLASGDFGGSVKVWDAQPGQPVRLETDGWPNRLAFHPDGRRLVTASGGYSREFAPQLWDLTTGGLLRTFRGHEGPVDSVALSQDGSLMVSGSSGRDGAVDSDQTARVWDVGTGQQRLVLDHPQSEGVEAVAFHPEDDALIATGCMDGTIRLWTIDPTGRTPPTSTLIGRHDAPIEALAFRPPLGRDLAVGTRDGSVHVWRVETGERLLTIPDLGERVHDVAFSVDGRLLAAANSLGQFQGGSATVWDMEAGRVRFTLPLSNTAFGVAFHPDGTRLAMASDDKTVKLWNLATGQNVLTLRGHTAGVLGVAFSPDGNRLASGSIDLTALVWDATPWPSNSVLAVDRSANSQKGTD